MIDSYISVEQEKREQQELYAINAETNLNTDLNVVGIRDGILGEPAQEQYGSELAYREGSVTGINQHSDQKYHIDLEQPF